MKYLWMICLISFFSSLVYAEDKSSGCGIGWAVTKRKSLASSSIRATTNNLLYLQSFGMTSGTLGCAKHSIVLIEKAPLHFAEANYDNLVVEMAEGKGEYLKTFASVLGCKPSSFSVFSDVIQSKYPEIITETSLTPEQLLDRVRGQIRNNSNLSKNCQAS